MSLDDAVTAIAPVTAALKRLGVPHYLGGSVASSCYGRPRTTVDADVVAGLSQQHVGPLASALRAKYYLSEGAASAAVASKSWFNLIHLATMFKVDVFAIKDRPYDRAALGRVREDSIDVDHPDARFPIAAAEDVILSKLEWYRLGDEVSDRQWLDVIGVLQVQAAALDEAYLDRWAAELGVADLLAEARRQSQ